jgi:hypothetical protein
MFFNIAVEKEGITFFVSENSGSLNVVYKLNKTDKVVVWPS